MSTETMNAEDLALQTQAVADFLLANPDFLAQHPDVLAQINVPHDTGGAISLTERQVANLRQKLAKVEDKLAELVGFGEENDAISAKVHRLSVALMTAVSTEDVSVVVQRHLGDDFAIPAVHLWTTLMPADNVPALLDALADLAAPRCGLVEPGSILQAFGEEADKLRSWALVPLREYAAHPLFGVLALGSEDPERFFAEMGTLYLERMGELISAALSATWLPAGDMQAAL